MRRSLTRSCVEDCKDRHEDAHVGACCCTIGARRRPGRCTRPARRPSGPSARQEIVVQTATGAPADPTDLARDEAGRASCSVNELEHDQDRGGEPRRDVGDHKRPGRSAPLWMFARYLEPRPLRPASRTPAGTSLQLQARARSRQSARTSRHAAAGRRART
jgi:hypothetical protein